MVPCRCLADVSALSGSSSNMSGSYRPAAHDRLIRIRWLSSHLFQRQGRTHERGFPGKLSLYSNSLRAIDAAAELHKPLGSQNASYCRRQLLGRKQTATAPLLAAEPN